MSVVGHTAVREVLEKSLPPVALLAGPEHVGKKTLARYLQHRHAPISYDRMWVTSLTSPMAAELSRFAMRAPQGPLKVAVVSLSKANVLTLNAALKLLEEPPSFMRFILVASAPVLPTIESRSEIYACGLLSDTEVALALEAHGLSADLAARQAPAGFGQVRPALESGSRSRTVVLSALRAALARDPQALSIALRNWDEVAQRLLRMWCQESLSGHWRVFTARDVLASQEFAMRLLTGLRLGARPRLTARAALEAAARMEKLCLRI
jgi:DNA polymerase III, delta subunit